MVEPLRDLDPAAAHQMVENAEARLLDVRRDDEWAVGHAPGAMHIPLEDLDPSGLTDMPTLVVICRSGRRSSMAVAKLAAAGLLAHNVSGGMEAWQSTGHRVVRPDGTPGTVI